MNLKRSFFYNFLKSNYYKYLAYRSLKPSFDIGKKRVYINHEEQKLVFKHEMKSKDFGNFFTPEYFNINLSFFVLELPGYMKKYKLKKGDVVLDIGSCYGDSQFMLVKK